MTMDFDDDDLMVYAPDQNDVQNTVYGYIQKYSEEHGTSASDPTNSVNTAFNDNSMPGRFEKMFKEAFQSGGVAAVEATKLALSDISKVEAERLQIAKSYSAELRDQNQQMSIQNQQIAATINRKNLARQSDETLQSTLESNLSKRSSDAKRASDIEPIPVIVKSFPGQEKANGNRGPAPAPTVQQTTAPTNPIRPTVPRAPSASGQGRMRPTNVSSGLDTYKEVLGKLGMNNILRSVNQFDGFFERIRRGSESLQKLGDTINPSKASIRLASNGSPQPGPEDVRATETPEAREAISGSTPIISRNAESKGGIGSVTQKMADTAEKASSVASRATEGGIAARAASTIGGGLSKAAGLIGRIASNPVVAVGTAALGAVKAGRDEMFNARRMGSLQGGSAGEGVQMQAQDRYQDLKNFLGISNVSGDDLDRFRQWTSQNGMDINSDAGSSMMDVMTYGKEQGLDPNVAGDVTKNIVAFGGSTDEAKRSLDDLKEAAKSTGQNLNTLAKVSTKVSTQVDKFQGGDNAQNLKLSTDTTNGVLDILKGANPSATSDQVPGLLSNPYFMLSLSQNMPEKDRYNLLSPELASSYAAKHPETTKKALNGIISGIDKRAYNSIYNSAMSSGKGYTKKEAQQMADTLTAQLNERMGLGALSSNASALGKEVRNSPDYTRVDVRVSASDDLRVKVNQQNSKEKAFSGMAPYTSVNNDRP